MKWALDQSVLVKWELSHKVKHFNYQPFYLQALAFGHKLWAITSRLRSQIQASEVSFLCRLAALFLRFRVRSSVIWEHLAIELCSSSSREKFRMLEHLVRRLLMFPSTGVLEVCQLA